MAEVKTPGTAPARATPQKKQPGITPEQLVAQIQKRAHEIYLRRGAAPGTAMGDWLQAEKEIKAKYGIAP